MIKLAFWAVVALDVLGIGLLFVLGLAAAGGARTNPLQVVLLLLVLPSLPLLASILVFTRAASGAWRLVALLLAAAPLIIAVSARALAEARMRLGTNAQGEMTWFRSGPMREIAEAILRNDASTVARLAPTVDVNRRGTADMTLLVLALRQLQKAPLEHGAVRALLAAGADPDLASQYEHPLSIAIQRSGASGTEPVRLLLDAGANPNLRSSFGTPVFFAATGVTAPPEVLALLLDRGAELDASGSDGQTALLSAAMARNWKATLLLLQRGADWQQGRTAGGLGVRELVDRDAGQPDPDGARAEVMRLLEQR